MRDMANNIHPLVAVVPQVATDNTAIEGAIIDLQGYGAVTFVVITGTIADADATLTPLLEHGDAANLSDAAAVADEGLIGTEALAAFAAADDAESRKLGYVGNRRYVRLTLTPAANTGDMPLAAMAILSHPVDAPTTNPPV